jgi:hypothetical protein
MYTFMLDPICTAPLWRHPAKGTKCTETRFTDVWAGFNAPERLSWTLSRIFLCFCPVHEYQLLVIEYIVLVRISNEVNFSRLFVLKVFVQSDPISPAQFSTLQNAYNRLQCTHLSTPSLSGKAKD